MEEGGARRGWREGGGTCRGRQVKELMRKRKGVSNCRLQSKGCEMGERKGGGGGEERGRKEGRREVKGGLSWNHTLRKIDRMTGR